MLFHLRYKFDTAVFDAQLVRQYALLPFTIPPELGSMPCFGYR